MKIRWTDDKLTILDFVCLSHKVRAQTCNFKFSFLSSLQHPKKEICIYHGCASIRHLIYTWRAEHLFIGILVVSLVHKRVSHDCSGTDHEDRAATTNLISEFMVHAFRSNWNVKSVKTIWSLFHVVHLSCYEMTSWAWNQKNMQQKCAELTALRWTHAWIQQHWYVTIEFRTSENMVHLATETCATWSRILDLKRKGFAHACKVANYTAS
jgi:hypothetical protein